MEIVICNEKPGGGESVRNFLDKIPDLNVVRGLSSVEEIRSVVRDRCFDLCVIGARSLDWWKRIQPELADVYDCLGKKVVLSHVLTPEYLVKSYWLGLNDVLYSSLPLKEIVSRCREVLAGERDISTTQSALGLAQYLPKESAFRFLKYDVDIEIMMMLVEGWTNEMIAERVCLALQTTRNRISRLLRDSGVDNRTQLALLMVR
jgi:DNA-binding NarL/FixJ family response regulator